MQVEALQLCDQLERTSTELPYGLAMYHPEWHQGVVGILASRIKERFHRPVIAFAPAGDGILKGSGRSVPGLHMRDALERLDMLNPGLMMKFGGHAMAAGLSLEEAKFDEFRQRFGELVGEWLDPAMLEGVIWSDGELAMQELSLTTAELLREGGRLLQDIDAVANRVRRVATGWEPQLTLSIDGVISPHTMLELVEAFYAMSPPTRLKLRDGIMSGTREALTSGRADLAIGVSNIASDVAGLQQAPLGDLLFIYVVAPHHPLASMPEPITDAVMLRHRAVAVADSAQRGGMTMGLLGGQDVLTVDTMQAKVQVQLRGLGGGFLPEPMVRPYLEAGRLVAKRVARPERQLRLHYAWGGPGFTAPGRALQWWLQQLQSPTTRKALLENHHHF